MYIIQVHSLEVPEPYYSAGTSSSSSPAVGLNPSVVTTLRCCVRLLRNLSGGPLSSPASRCTTLFVAAVPSYLPVDDFILFCEGNISDFIELCFFRNDRMEDRYSVLITLANRLSADEFYCSHNGKRFRPPEVEVCHMYFVQSYKCFAYVEEANAVPPGYVELPTCPVCLERLDHDTSGIQITQCDHPFQCPCVLKWANLSCQVCRLFQQQDEKLSCAMCGTFENLWACMICDFIGCGRYEGGHALRHWEDTQHCYSLGLEKQQVWDYITNSYVHRLHQSKVDGKSVMKNSSCMSHIDECGTCGYGEDSSFGGAISNNKVEVGPYDDIFDHVNYEDIYHDILDLPDMSPPRADAEVGDQGAPDTEFVAVRVVEEGTEVEASEGATNEVSVDEVRMNRYIGRCGGQLLQQSRFSRMGYTAVLPLVYKDMEGMAGRPEMLAVDETSDSILRTFLSSVDLKRRFIASRSQLSVLEAEKKLWDEEKAKLVAEAERLAEDNAKLVAVKEFLAEENAKLVAEKDLLAEENAQLAAENELLAEEHVRLVSEKEVVEAKCEERVSSLDTKLSMVEAARADDREAFTRIANFHAFSSHVRALNLVRARHSHPAWSAFVYPASRAAPPLPVDWANIRDDELPVLPGQTTSSVPRPYSRSSSATRSSTPRLSSAQVDH